MILVFVKRYKKDPVDQTIAINACVIKLMNADFDGDELYALPIFEYQMYLKFLSVHPSQFLFNTAAVGLSSDIGLLVQNVVSLEYYVSEDPDSEYYEELS